MFAFLKTHGQKLALLLLVSQLFTTTVLASPFEFDIETPTDFVARAQSGAYVGSKCRVNTDCYSKNCVTGSDGIAKTCQRQPPGGPCFENGNCNSRQCDLSKGTCKTAVNSVCTNDFDCTGSLPYPYLKCKDKKCRLLNSYQCNQNYECLSDICPDGQCRAPPQAPSAPCLAEVECLSGDCALSTCANPNGSLYPCTGYRCVGYPLGHTCANNGECKAGFCRSGKCVASKDGDACLADYQCTGSTICLKGKCSTPGNGTLLQNDVCAANSQCLSGVCSNAVIEKDETGNLIAGYDITGPPRCGYIDNGRSGCKTFIDCTTGLCQNGTCKAGLNGDRCQFSFQCKSRGCSPNGICYDLLNNAGKGEACDTYSSCLSRSCLIGPVVRPRLSDGVPTTFEDATCDGSYNDGPCRKDYDCNRGTCSNGTCTYISLGAPCEADTQCDTQTCAKSSPTATKKTCILGDYYAECDGDTCYTGKCVKLPRPTSAPKCYGNGRRNESDDFCAYYGCKAVALGGTCRSTAEDCDTATQKCSNNNGGVKGRTQLPGMVDLYLNGGFKIDEYVTHTSTLDEINKGIDDTKSGSCIRCVVSMK